MGFGFKKSLKIGGVRFNFGKTGLTSMSVGKKGLTANISKKGIRTTASISGTGLSYSKLHKLKTEQHKSTGNNKMAQVKLDRPNCPHCGSIQTKYNSKQSNLSELIYKCNNCGYQFIINVNLEPLQRSINTSAPKKKGSFLGKLFKWMIIFIIAFLAISYALDAIKPSGKPNSKKPVEVQTSRSSIQDPFDKESKSKQDSIENSTNQNDTLSIKTTIRESNQ
ncbi:MAG: hypothetical protein GAK29_04737 [Acinetobacter bereziniae]|uniref:DUF4236 domain-containing protein n=1 Tax=Acinetobacter bereziniae TaxID=106648 RepID=A0A833U8X9_ACIBZ|nr:MAG: hypothetical protein GAK29_04737 [Acinetobacter bereziniae]